MDMANISPDIEGGAELVAEIRRRHPMIRVGVTQRAGSNLDPGSLVSWSARRAGALVYRPVVKFTDTGTQGGKYQFALGRMKLSEDNMQLTMNIDPKIPSGLNGYDLAQVLNKRATPEDPTYDASWAAVVRSVSTPNPTQLLVRLQRPHVLPQALLQFSFPDSNDNPSPLAGLYRLNASDQQETSFVLRNREAAGTAPVEIVEVFYEDPKVAANDLVRGEIDVLDQIYPSDARRYEQSKLAKVGHYLLPSVHMLVPVSEHPYLIKDKFRRALMYATNRPEVLRGELIGSDNPQDGRVLSGPFPMGSETNDPLNYAYDPNIKPKPYDPRLAKLLLYMVEKEVAAQYQKLKQPVPENKPLRLGVPNYELAKIAAQALLEQWQLVGVKAEIVPLPEGKAFDEESKCDLVYLTATMWEPAIDIERLLGGSSPAKSNNPFIVQALTKVRKARSWRETRVALQDVHRLVDYHLPIMPLWQITDRFAYSQQLQGLADRSVSLYDKIPEWRLGAPGVPVASSSP
jgi:ABC-type transport system substrate-binding protein